MTRKRIKVKTQIRRLLRAGPVSAGQVAADVGVTRQAAHYHLRQMREAGEIEFAGSHRGRGTKYVLSSILDAEFDLLGLSEHEAWESIADLVSTALGEADEAIAIHRYAFTEMMNNAIDHSEGTRVSVRARQTPEGLELSVADDGVGVFRKIAESRGLDSMTSAIAALTKGKVTTDPSRHTGEGIFFTSRAVGVFVLESDGWAWEVVNAPEGEDWGLAESPIDDGTRVTWTVSANPIRALEDVFEPFTDSQDFTFSRTHTQVQLFSFGAGLISRSEARQLAQGLDSFSEVVLDFTNVDRIGQGFADELLRVWANAHPEVTLLPTNMAPAVELMIQRALATRVERNSDSLVVSGELGGTVTSSSGGGGVVTRIEPKED